MIPIKNKDKALLAILLVFIIIKIILATTLHPAGWDEAVYTGMGKHIYSGGNAGLWEEIRPPGLPILLGAAWKTGLPFPTAQEILIALFGAATIAITYLTGKKLFNETTGLLAALLAGGTTLFFTESSKFMTEIPSTALATAAAYMLISGRKNLAGLLAGLAAIFKFPHLLMLAILLTPAAIELAKSRSPKKAAKEATAAIPFIATIAAFTAANYAAYEGGIKAAIEPLILAASHAANPLHAVQGTLQNIMFYPATLLKENIFFAFLPLGLLAIKELKQETKKKTAIALSYLIIYSAYLTATINKQERFALLLMPTAAVFAAAGLYKILLMQKGTSKTGIAITAALFTMAAFASYNIITDDIKYVNERRQATQQDYTTIKEAALSSTPLPAYYTDNKITPYYFSTADGKEGIKRAAQRFEENSERMPIIYNKEDFYCTQKDEYCNEQLEKIKTAIS